MSGDNASGRFTILFPREPGAAAWVHRWLGDEFPHTRGDSSPTCPCRPYYVPAGDTRSLDEIADDMEEEEGNQQ
jgi:hypothetical protein